MLDAEMRPSVYVDVFTLQAAQVALMSAADMEVC